MKYFTLLFSSLLALPLFAGGIVGKWDMAATDPDGQIIKTRMIITEAEGKLSGTVVVGERSIPMQELQFATNQLTSKLPWGEMILTLKLTLDGDKLDGVWIDPNGSSGPLKGTRVTEAAATESSGSLAGKWQMTAITGSGREMKVDLELKQEGGKYTGNIITQDGQMVPVASAVVEGAAVTLKIDTDQGSYTLKLNREGDAMKGTYTSPDGQTGSLTAKR